MAREVAHDIAGTAVVGLPGVHAPVSEQPVGRGVDIVHVVGDLGLREGACPYAALGDIAVQRTAAAIGGSQVETARIVARQVDGLALRFHARGILPVDIDVPRRARPDCGDVVPLLLVERLVGSCGLVGVVTDLDAVGIDLHVAETYAADALDTHDGTDIRIAGLEAEHVYAGFERELRKGCQVGILLERSHLVDVARSQVDRLADHRGLQHDEERAARFEHAYSAGYGLDAHGDAIGHALGELRDGRHREVDRRRGVVAGQDGRFGRTQGVAFLGRNLVVFAVLVVIGSQQFGPHFQLDPHVVLHNHRGGYGDRGLGRGFVDGH